MNSKDCKTILREHMLANPDLTLEYMEDCARKNVVEYGIPYSPPSLDDDYSFSIACGKKNWKRAFKDSETRVFINNCCLWYAVFDKDNEDFAFVDPENLETVGFASSINFNLNTVLTRV